MLRELISIGIIIASVTLVFGFVKPEYDSTDDLKIKIVDLDLALDESIKLQKAWSELMDRYSMLDDSKLERLNKFLPDNVDNVKLVVEIDRLVSQFGMSLTNVDIATSEDVLKSKEEDGYGTVTIDFDINGQYENFLQFLEKLEGSLRLLDIRSIVFSSKESSVNGEDGDEQLFKLSIDTYWLN